MCSTDLRRSSEGANKIWLTTETGRLKDHNLEMQAPKNKAVKMGFFSVIVLTLKRVWLKKESYLACQLVIFLHKSKFGEMEVFGFFLGNQMESKGSVCGRLFAGGFLWWKFFENFPPSSNQMKSDGGVCERKTHESFLWEGGSLSWKFFESFFAIRWNPKEVFVGGRLPFIPFSTSSSSDWVFPPPPPPPPTKWRKLLNSKNFHQCPSH